MCLLSTDGCGTTVTRKTGAGRGCVVGSAETVAAAEVGAGFVEGDLGTADGAGAGVSDFVGDGAVLVVERGALSPSSSALPCRPRPLPPRPPRE